jgi:rRNA maturation protein Nop10
MVSKQLEEGFVTSNGVLHAAERRLQGLCAVCGAGKIIQLVPGRFDPDDQRACPVCAGRAIKVQPAGLRLI